MDGETLCLSVFKGDLMRRGLLGVIDGFALLLSGLLALLSLPDGASAGTPAVASSGATTAAASHFTFTPTIGPSGTGTTGDNQGF